MKEENVDTLIPAYNEERNIENLLKIIEKQSIYKKVGNIWVISDASTDNTHSIVKEISRGNRKIKLIIKEKRIGKFDSINRVFKLSNADILIMLDADIEFEQDFALKELIEPFSQNEKIGVTVLKNKPKLTRKSVGALASLFSYHLREEIIKSKEDYKFNNFYSLVGRAVAIRKKLYKSIVIPNDPGDDQHIFFKAIAEKHLIFYVESAYVKYKIPLTIRDWLKQNIRYKQAISIKKQMYGIKVKEDISIGYKFILSLIYTILKHPIEGICWIPLYIIGIVKYSITKNKAAESTWQISESTK